MIGLGCGPLGALSRARALDLLHGALDLGITLFDTAPSYGDSELHLGALARREGVTLITKGGYGVAGVPDWTPRCIELGVEQALARLGRVDVFLLHSCDHARTHALIDALVSAKARGRVGAIGYSGDGPALASAIDAGFCDVVECSYNVVDQASRDAIERARARSIRVLIKRPLANHAFASDSRREDVSIYRDRFAAMHLRFDVDACLRFAAAMGTPLVGTTRVDHLRDAVESCRRGPLPSAQERDIIARFAAVGRDWPGVV